ncbi:hypothetical protein Pmar_PMAR006221 [Perkinsus marinus ATCC 50983]|uniref:Lipocalin n=1 Tax=Perkinsus marinus (strain ATCC 50983 / TXsc) TaxID=423536 RepID=C5LAF4_PERM5|nr:hypothetical protein Pmar_PMAR006221 [Perkinsus marinus ATCC 50983]EER06410.1 hypothetical protein Pmar_PMAR006221 [Perkinsus marinus ATCC 50983]|eukprot:XP_002774594.1 hypothetical protein Pmar_PMAR006221 [Perkinsus marinus ATCC 50983]
MSRIIFHFAACIFTACALRTSKESAQLETNTSLDMACANVYTYGDTCELSYDMNCEDYPTRLRDVHWYFRVDNSSGTINTKSIECSKRTYLNRHFPDKSSGGNPLAQYRITVAKRPNCYAAVQQIHAAMKAPTVFSRFYAQLCDHFQAHTSSTPGSWWISLAEKEEDDEDYM